VTFSENKFDWFAATDGGVKYFSIRELAGVMDSDGLAGCSLDACSSFGFNVFKSACCDNWYLLVLGKFFPGGGDDETPLYFNSLIINYSP
jgi:hypothetical protein